MNKMEWLLKKLRSAFDSDFGEVRCSLKGSVIVEIDDFSEEFDCLEDFEDWVRSL